MGKINIIGIIGLILIVVVLIGLGVSLITTPVDLTPKVLVEFCNYPNQKENAFLYGNIEAVEKCKYIW